VLVRDRAVSALSVPGASAGETADLADVCELAFRLALSCVAAPPGEAGTAGLVRGVLLRYELA
jgi:hypothetical protein